MARLATIFAPKEREFFDLFEASARNLVRASELLDKLLENYPESRSLAAEILECEQTGDRLTHEIIERMNRTFVTPIDREDIIALASGLDDVVDFTEEVADYLGLYKIEAPMEQSQRLARVLLDASRQIELAVPKIRDFGDITAESNEIHRLENDGDRIVREAVAALFETGIDPMFVIRWKDIFDRLEDAIDATETAANVMQGIIIKNR